MAPLLDPLAATLSHALVGLGATDTLGAAVLLAEIERRLFGAPASVQLGHYHLLRPIGAGGFGTIYAAHDPRLERTVAVKLLHRERAARDADALLREARAMARLSHPHVVTVHDIGTYNLPGHEQSGLFVVMELIDGESLQQWLAAEPRTWPAILEVFLAAGRGLAAAHGIGLVHRDFKPSNVLRGRDGSVRVADFGLAGAHDELRSALGEAGRVTGTPAYMAPELFAGAAPAGPSADQFAFCVALFEALYARQPFPVTSLGERLAAIAAGAVTPVPEDSPVPTWLRDALLRGLAAEPGRRFPGLPELLRALDPAAAHTVGDVAAIRARIHLLEPGVVRYHEVPVPSAFTVAVMRAELSRLTAGLDAYALVVDLGEANMPGPEVRQELLRMFSDPAVRHVGVLAGGDPVKTFTATLVVGHAVPRERFTVHEGPAEALAACRAALARRPQQSFGEQNT
ncbi:MAG: serine/threonine protein kinase [Myxococcales bacterium]|nr:serine/threonine protein kinase [Myxococcales bacterium]